MYLYSSRGGLIEEGTASLPLLIDFEENKVAGVRHYNSEWPCI